MKKRVKRALICAVALVLLVFGCSFSYPSDSYSITYGNDAVLSAEAVKFGRTITGVDLGIGGFKDPMCVRCAPDGRLLIADTGNHRVVVTDSQYTVQFVLQTFFARRTGRFSQRAERRIRHPRGGDLCSRHGEPESAGLWAGRKIPPGNAAPGIRSAGR